MFCFFLRREIKKKKVIHPCLIVKNKFEARKHFTLLLKWGGKKWKFCQRLLTFLTCVISFFRVMLKF